MTLRHAMTASLVLGLIATGAATAFEPVISLPGEHQIATPLGKELEVLATREQTGGQLGIIILSGDGPGPSITHSREAEFWYVLEGTYEFHIGDKVVEGGPGTFVAVDAGQPHGFISKSPGRLLTIFSPGGYEHFFMDWGDLGLERGPELGKLENLYGVTRPPRP